MFQKIIVLAVMGLNIILELTGIPPIPIYQPMKQPQTAVVVSTTTATPTEEIKVIQSPTLVPVPSKIISKTVKPSPKPTDNTPWGVAQQVGEHTWTMKIGEDATMATPKEVFEALNEYRKRNGKALLIWDDRLRDYAQSRADFFESNKGLDEHKGFMDYLQNQDGFNKIGFDALGENSSFGYRMNGVHLIEWIFAGDKPHDDNQLNNDWAYAGVGIKGVAVDIIFGTGRM